MPSYKLYYFDGRGRAEISRLIFAAADVKYEDIRLPYPPTEDDKALTPIGQFPYLDVDGVKVPQSISIARFLAREFNLAGKTNLEQAQADAIVDTLIELVNIYYSTVFPIQNADEKDAALNAFLADKAAKGAASVEKLITAYGSNGFAVGDSLTYADLLVFNVGSELFEKHPEFSEKFPKLAAANKAAATHERIVEYIKNRPVTPF